MGSGLQISRSSNIELFRILLMLSIVAHHYVVNSGVNDIICTPPYGWHSYFLFIFGMWGKIGINCFVLITGYYMCKSQITVRKFLKLFLEMLFYNVACYICFYISDYEVYSIRGMLHAFNPINSIKDDFGGCFLVYYLLIPFINTLVQNLTKKQHQLLIIICMIFAVIMPHYSRFEFRFNYVEWFAIIHLIASYIRFYYGEIEYPNNTKSLRYIFGALGIGISSVVIMMLGHSHGVHGMWQLYEWVCDCNALLAVVTSIMLFWGFKTLHIRQSRIINVIASSTFGVLLIHSNSDAMRKWLWQDVCHNVDWIDSPLMLLHAIGCVLAIFVVCVIIDKVRIYMVEKPTFIFVDKILAKYGIK